MDVQKNFTEGQFQDYCKIAMLNKYSGNIG